MMSKRLFNENEGDCLEVPARTSKRPISSVDVMRILSLDNFESKLEHCLRNVVREVLEGKIQPRSSSASQIDSSRVRNLQLHFVKKLLPVLYTGNKIESEDKGEVEIILFDATSDTRIISGPLSSLKIEIIVLDGDFGKGGEEGWTEEEFKDHIVRGRADKRPLIVGELVATLRNGSCFIGDIRFTDNSKWIKSRKFRLGARIFQEVSSEIKIREARSEAFVVKDQRGESNRKDYPPSLGDDVCRLRRIAKDGVFHTRLASKGVHSVKDFLRLYVTNPSLLRKILGDRISNKTWDTIIEHANSCVLDHSLYGYYIAEHQFGLKFNSIYKVVGVMFDGQNYQPLSSLTSSQMDFVEKMKQYAYKRVNDFIPISDLSIDDPLSILFPGPESLSNPSLVLPHSDYQCTHEDQWESQQGYTHSTPTSFTHEDVTSDQLEFCQTVVESFPISDAWPLPFNG